MLRDRDNREVVVGSFVVGGLVLLSILIFGGFTNRWFQQEKGTTVSAVFANTGLLSRGEPVRVDGVQQGRVKDLTLNADGRSTTVELEVYEESLPLHKNATARIRFRNALGGKYYVDLDPGTASAGSLPGQQIALADTEGQVEVDQIVATLGEDERTGLKTLLREVPYALEGDGTLDRALGTTADAAPDLRDGIRALRGEEEPDIRDLVSNVDSTVRALGSDTRSLRDVVGGGAVALATTARRSRDIQEIIERGAAMQSRVTRTLAGLDGTLDRADPVLALLKRPAGDVGPTLRVLRPAVVDADRLLQQARPLLRSLRPAARSLARVAQNGRPLVDELEPSIVRADENILPDLGKEDMTSGRSTSLMIGATLAGLGAAASNYDGISHLVGLALGGGERALDTTPCKTYFLQPDTPPERLIQCKDTGQILLDLLTYQPTPPANAKRKK